MLKNRRRQEKTIVGLEMDPSHLAAAQVAVNGRISVTKGAVATLRPGILRDGEVVDPVALTEALRALFAEHELPTQVRLGIANQRIVVRTLDVVPVQDPKLLEDARPLRGARTTSRSRWTRRCSTSSRSATSSTPDGPRTRVVIVAVRRDMIDRMIASTREAGLDVVGIDLSAFGMVRALHAPGTDGAVLYVNLAGLTNVAVANDTGCLFTRAASGGLDPMRPDARRAPRPHDRARPRVDPARRPRDAARRDRGRRRPRRRRAPDARGRRPHRSPTPSATR